MTNNINVLSDDITLNSQFPGDVVINHQSTTTLTLRQVHVLDGSLIVHTLGDLIVLDAQLLSNTGEYHVELNAGKDVIISQLIAGDYAATTADAAALRISRPTRRSRRSTMSPSSRGERFARMPPATRRSMSWPID